MQTRNELWQDNEIQFSRLIAEANAAGLFEGGNYQLMLDSMNLTDNEVKEIITRASSKWEGILDHHLDR
jgi:hypothetical protein